MNQQTSRMKGSLFDLCVWVAAAGFFFRLIRGATGFWNMPGPVLNLNRSIGVALIALAVALFTKIVLETLRHRKERASWFVLVAVAAACAGVLALIVNVAGLGEVADDSRSLGTLFNSESAHVRLGVIVLALGMIGVLLAFVPIRERMRSRPAGNGQVAVSVVLSLVAGLLIVTVWIMPIIYLVMLAIEAVKNAIQQPGLMFGIAQGTIPIGSQFGDPTQWRSFHAQVLRAGMAGLAGLLSCILTAHWLGVELRRVEVAPRSWPRIAY